MKVACVDITGKYQKISGEIAGTLGRSNRRGGSSGFTLIELIVVTTIIGVLVILVLPSYDYFVSKVKVTRAIAEIRGLEKDVLASITEKNVVPNTLSDVGRGGLRDPWGNLYQFLNLANGGSPRQNTFLINLNTDFDIFSMGRDGLSQQVISDPNSLDDIVRASDGGWVGKGGDF